MAEVGAGDHRVADPLHGEVREGGEGRLDGVREPGLLAALGGEVDEGAGEGDDVGGEIEGVAEGAHAVSLSPGLSPEPTLSPEPSLSPSLECLIPYSQ